MKHELLQQSFLNNFSNTRKEHFFQSELLNATEFLLLKKRSDIIIPRANPIK